MKLYKRHFVETIYVQRVCLHNASIEQSESSIPWRLIISANNMRKPCIMMK